MYFHNSLWTTVEKSDQNRTVSQSAAVHTCPDIFKCRISLFATIIDNSPATNPHITIHHFENMSDT